MRKQVLLLKPHLYQVPPIILISYQQSLNEHIITVSYFFFYFSGNRVPRCSRDIDLSQSHNFYYLLKFIERGSSNIPITFLKRTFK